jgi:signal transduction histidine kinase
MARHGEASDGEAVQVITAASIKDQGPWRDVSLPHAWVRSDLSGRVVYQMNFEAAQAAEAPWAVYLPRVGNRFDVSVNGERIGQVGVLGVASTDTSLQPHLFPFRPGLVKVGANVLTLTVEGERNRNAGLSRVHVGPDAALRPVFERRNTWQTGGAVALTVMCSVFALLALALGWALRDPTDLLFALSGGFCAFRAATNLVSNIPFDPRWWAWAVDMSYSVAVMCIFSFCVRALGLPTRKWDIGGAVYLLFSLCMVSWHSMALRSDIRSLWLVVCLVYAVVLMSVFVFAWLKRRNLTSTALAMASFAAVAFGGYDFLRMYRLEDGYGDPPFLRFAAAAFLIAMAFVIVDRLLTSLQKERQLLQTRDAELAAMKRELVIQYGRQTQAEAAAARAEERQRIVQDLHDGMGLQLNGLLGLVEKARPDPAELQMEVRHSIEQLRTLVDGSQAFDGTLAELLGHIRHRIETRLRAQRIQLRWQNRAGDRIAEMAVDAVPALNLQHLMFELCTNVIKHADATAVDAACDLFPEQSEPQELVIEFSDNGQHPGNSAKPGVGSRSIDRRVASLGGTCSLEGNGGGGWHYQLRFPLSRLVMAPAT